MSNQKHKTSVGGQALIEGIMMQGPKGMAISVRKADGEIDTQYKDVTRLRDKHRILGWPIIRGIVGYIESMILGYRCLMHSADVSGMGDAEEEELSKFEIWLNEKLGDKLMGVVTALATVVGFALAFVIFFYLPILLFDLLNGWTGGVLTDWKGTIEGVIKIIIFVVYILLVSRMRDIDRTFQYHGAEHKTIFCYENGLDLTVENVKAQSRFHPRCGTSFIFVMLLLGIILSTIASRLFPAIAEVRLLWLCLRLLVLLPIIVGLGYEFIRYAGRHDNRMVRILSAPGLWMQRLTTKEPKEDGIIEVGIEALKAVITENPEDDAIK